MHLHKIKTKVVKNGLAIEHVQLLAEQVDIEDIGHVHETFDELQTLQRVLAFSLIIIVGLRNF